MPDARLQRTREAYEHELTPNEIAERWLDAIGAQRIRAEYDITINAEGWTHRVRRPDVFKVRP